MTLGGKLTESQSSDAKVSYHLLLLASRLGPFLLFFKVQ